MANTPWRFVDCVCRSDVILITIITNQYWKYYLHDPIAVRHRNPMTESNMKRCHSSLHRLARWYRNTVHLSRRGAIWAALLEILSCPGYLPPRKAERMQGVRTNDLSWGV
jgi:hypothetical protein